MLSSFQKGPTFEVVVVHQNYLGEKIKSSC